MDVQPGDPVWVMPLDWQRRGHHGCMAGTVNTAERIIMHRRHGAMGGVLKVEMD
jgi:hypothetical protein